MVWRWLSRMFNSAFYNNSDKQDDIDEISDVFSNVVMLLKEDDPDIVRTAVKMFDYILEMEGGRERIVNTPQMVASLIDVLNSSSDLVAIISKILYELSQFQKGLLSIYQSNGIPVLIQLLSDPEETVIFTVVTLYNLLKNQEGSKEAVYKAGGLPKLIILLKQNDFRLRCVAIECLQLLAFRNQKNKILILSNDVPAELVYIMKTYSCEPLLYCTSGLLKVLSACSKNKRAIIAAGGMHALGKHLNNTSTRLVINCVWTLRNLSDALNEERSERYILKILVQLLRHGEKNIVTCTAGILSNLTCNNAGNKVIVCQEMGVCALVDAILEAGNAKEILEPSIRTLRNLTRLHVEAEKAQNIIRLHSGLEPIVKLLQPPSSWSLIRDVTGLLKNLTLCPKNSEPLRALGTVDILKNMLISFYQDITKKWDGFTYYETQRTIIGGVQMEDIVEGIMSVLLNLARNINVRAQLKDNEIINTFVRILYNENENIQCIVADLFCEMSSDPGGILIVESSGAIPFLCSCLNSRNQRLASTSESLVAQLLTLKPKKYKSLSTELI